MSTFRTRVDPWGAVLHLATDEGSYRRLARRFDLDAEPAGVGSTSLHLDAEGHYKPHLVVWITPGLDAVPLMAVIVHESVHVAAMLLEHVGSTLHGESETLAYLAEWVAVWMMGRCGGSDAS